MSAMSRFVLCLMLLVSTLFAPHALAQDTDPASLWADFNHYTLVARPDLAADSGQSLLTTVGDDGGKLLEVVEASDYADLKALDRALKIETLNSVAAQLANKIQQARIDRSRDPKRIEADIEQLALGGRPFTAAVERLRAAGQYAAPQLLATLQDENKARLHPFVIRALSLIGQDIVDPLSVALPDLDPVVMGQIAQVLAEIGYPHPMPFMKTVMEQDDADASAKQIVATAYGKLNSALSQPMPKDVTAASLFVLLADSQYIKSTKGERLPGYDSSDDKGVVWAYSKSAGLVAIKVPGLVHGDVKAMRSAKRALALQSEFPEALTIFLAANLRRENRLAGETDPSYPASLQAPSYYLMMAGVDRQHEVLSIALDDQDKELALDAIASLSRTAGPAKLVNADGAQQPLLAALTWPDRLIRIRAALALAAGRSTQAYPGSALVVPVLGDAVRESGDRYALVLGADTNAIVSSIQDDMGYNTQAATSVKAAFDQAQRWPGVDLVVVAGSAADVIDYMNQVESSASPKLRAAPLLALTNETFNPALQALEENYPGRVTLSQATVGSDAFTKAVEMANANYRGSEIDEDLATALALESLATLNELAKSETTYDVALAQPALIAALSDNRDEVAIGAGAVLASLAGEEAQQAVADAALAAGGDVQVAQLQNLAQSARLMGNMITDVQADKLLKLVQTSTGEVALAAAEAHGALTLPTSHAVELIAK